MNEPVSNAQQSTPVAEPVVQTPMPLIPEANLTSDMRGRRNRKILLASTAVIVFLLVLITTLLVLNINKANSVAEASNNNDNQSSIGDEDTDAEQDETEEVAEVEEDEETPVQQQNPQLTQECKDSVKGIKFGMPSGWTCTTSSSDLPSGSFAITAKSNDSSKFEFTLSNLGRGGYTCANGGYGEGCTQTDFYKNANMDLKYSNTSTGGEIFGFVNLKNYENEWISITGNKIGKNQTISSADKALLVSMLETIHTFPVSNAASIFNVSSPVKISLNVYQYKEWSNSAFKMQIPDSSKWSWGIESSSHGGFAGKMNDQGGIAFDINGYYPIFTETGVPESMDDFKNFYFEEVLSNFNDADRALYTNIETFTIQNFEIMFISPKADNSKMTPKDTMNLGSSMLIFDYSGKINPRIITVYGVRTYDDSANTADYQHNILKYFGEKLSLSYP